MSIYAEYAIFSEKYVIASDRRMKTNIVDVPDNLALQQVRDIPCRYYEYIDKVSKGNTNVVGFIAQEVKEVLPSAIQLVKRYIPDEYRILENITWAEIADTSGNITYKMSSDLTDVSGVNYKFMVGNDLSENEIEEKIVGNADNTFTFDAVPYGGASTKTNLGFVFRFRFRFREFTVRSDNPKNQNQSGFRFRVRFSCTVRFGPG